MSLEDLGCAKTQTLAPPRRNIFDQLHLRESNHTAHARFDTLLENCVFYIPRMYEVFNIRELTAICLLSANGQEGAPSWPCRREQKHLSTEPGDCEKDEPNGPHNGLPPDRASSPCFVGSPRLGNDPVAFEAAASVGKIFATY